MILNGEDATSTLLGVGNDGVLVDGLDGEWVQDPNSFDTMLLTRKLQGEESYMPNEDTKKAAANRIVAKVSKILENHLMLTLCSSFSFFAALKAWSKVIPAAMTRTESESDLATTLAFPIWERKRKCFELQLF